MIELARYRSPHVKMPDSSQFAPFVRFIRSIEEPKKAVRPLLALIGHCPASNVHVSGD